VGREFAIFNLKNGNEGGSKMKKLSSILILIVSVCLLFSGVSLAKSFTIGLSNGWVGSEWRTQMIDEAKAAAAKWQKEDVEVKIIVQSSNVDVQGQIAHVRNFINQGVDAIIINPNSPTAFDPVFRQAKKQGIIVVSTDAEVSSKDAIYVGIDQKGWAMKSAGRHQRCGRTPGQPDAG
jgi:ribose transport system substrate-binding protein